MRCQAKTATVAVKPCRNVSPPTGPISPAAKNPAAGRAGELVVDGLGVVVAAPEQAPAAAVAGEQQRSRRRAPAQRAHAHAERLAEVAVGALGVARVQPHDLARAHLGRDRDLAGVRVGAHQPAHEEVALQVVGLVRVDHDPHQQPALDERQVLRRQRLDRLAQLLERRPPRQLEDHVALGGGDRQLGPDRRRALRHARQQLDAVQPHPDRALVDHLLAEEQGGGAARHARRREAADDRHRRRRLRQEAQHRVGRERSPDRRA